MTLIFVLIFITIVSGELWRYFIVLPIFAFMMYLVDLMFLGADEFLYEPNYAAWEEKVTDSDNY